MSMGKRWPRNTWLIKEGDEKVSKNKEDGWVMIPHHCTLMGDCNLTSHLRLGLSIPPTHGARITGTFFPPPPFLWWTRFLHQI